LIQYTFLVVCEVRVLELVDKTGKSHF